VSQMQERLPEVDLEEELNPSMSELIEELKRRLAQAPRRAAIRDLD